MTASYVQQPRAQAAVLGEQDAAQFARDFIDLTDAVESFIQGKTEVVRLALTCLLAGGHLLLEDVPGVGKTSLARAYAAALGLNWRRIQCTPDLLPSDITGTSIYHQASGEFVFRPGPVFANVVLADELNRASPRTQSALLEVMQERTVTVDGEPLKVPSPFLVIATQNPLEMDGTYALPEAQIDRFLIKTSVGYPAIASETRMLAAHHANAGVEDVPQVGDTNSILRMMSVAESVYVSPSVIDYIARLIAATRDSRDFRLGASPRGGIGLLRTTRVWALARGRTHVTPGDIQALLVPVLAHRVEPSSEFQASGGAVADAISRIGEATPAPQGDMAS